MKKGFKKILLGCMLLSMVTVLPLTSCSLFEEDGYLITDIDHRIDPITGNVVVMISTNSEENPLITFTIPQGIPGDDGVSIENIEPTISGDGKAVIITITFVDNALPPKVITVPIVDGKDGRGIETVDLDYDENGNVIMTVFYTDGTSEAPIVIPKGEEGNGIEHTDVDYISDPNNVIITIIYTSEDKDPTIIKIPRGRGVESIVYSETESNETTYVLVITYTDGFVDYIRIPRPKSSEWHTGVGTPKSTLGKAGDFYLDQTNGYVYQKNENGEWQFILGMLGTGTKEKYDVKFIPIDGYWEDGSSDTLIYKVYYGDFLELDEIPIPYRDDYEFAGWYTSSEYNPNAGQFTDLTPVLKDITLYPRWIQ